MNRKQERERESPQDMAVEHFHWLVIVISGHYFKLIS